MTYVGRVTRFVNGRPFVVSPSFYNGLERGPCDLLSSVPPLVEGDLVLFVETSSSSIAVLGKLV